MGGGPVHRRLQRLPHEGRAGVRHLVILVERTRLQHAALVREVVRGVHVERVDNARVVPDLEDGELVRRVPARGADHHPAVGVHFADRLERAVRKAVPLRRVDVAHLVQELEGDLGRVVEAALDLQPERHEAVLQLGRVEELHLLRDVAVVADRLVEVEDGVDLVLAAPADELHELPHRPLTVLAGRLLEHDLVEAEADVVEAPHLDALHVALGDVRVEVGEVALRDVEALVLGQHVEPLVVREPAAHAHADRESRPFLRHGAARERQHDAGHQAGNGISVSHFCFLI